MVRLEICEELAFRLIHTGHLKMMKVTIIMMMAVGLMVLVVNECEWYILPWWRRWQWWLWPPDTPERTAQSPRPMCLPGNRSQSTLSSSLEHYTHYTGWFFNLPPLDRAPPPPKKMPKLAPPNLSRIKFRSSDCPPPPTSKKYGDWPPST